MFPDHDYRMTSGLRSWLTPGSAAFSPTICPSFTGMQIKVGMGLVSRSLDRSPFIRDVSRCTMLRVSLRA